jgi:hypothetical protein
MVSIELGGSNRMRSSRIQHMEKIMSRLTLRGMRVSWTVAMYVVVTSLAVTDGLGRGSESFGEGTSDSKTVSNAAADLHVSGGVTTEFQMNESPSHLAAPAPTPISAVGINEELAVKLAIARARWQWGDQVILGSVMELYGLDGQLLAYDIDFTLDGEEFGNYVSVATDWQEYCAGRRSDIRRRHEGRTEDGTTPLETGARKYGSVTVTATYDAPPFRGVRAGVSNFYAAGWVAKKIAAIALGSGNPELNRVIINGSWPRLYEFTNGSSTVVVQGHEPWGWYDADDLYTAAAQASAISLEQSTAELSSMGMNYDEEKEIYRSQNQEAANSWLMDSIPATSPVFIPDYSTDFTPYYWFGGCTPTAASMVFNYYDEHLWCGRLTGHYMNRVDPTDPTSTVCHVSDMLPAMRSRMNTDGEGNTQPEDVYPGMLDYANIDCGYSFGAGIDRKTTVLSWFCDEAQAEIDGGYPFVWSSKFYPNADGTGHSVAVVGYDTAPDPDEFACFNTWGGGNEIEWVSCHGPFGRIAYYDGPHPGGYDSYHVKLSMPDGHQPYLGCTSSTTFYGGASAEISWDNHGIPAAAVRLDYSTDGGDSWTFITTTDDDGYYSWGVPCISANNCRVKITQLWGDGSTINSDGSYGNFAIQLPSTPTIPYPTYPSYAATCVEKDVRLAWEPTSIAGGFEVQIGTSCGSGRTYSTPDEYLDVSLSPNTEYYWRVRARRCAIWGSWSLCSSFETGPPVPGQPALLLPVDGAACKDTSVVLNWHNVAAAAYYKVQLGTSCNTGEIRTVTNSTETWGGLNRNTTYYWRVRALNSCDEGEGWTACRSFTTAEAPPRIPGLLSPPDGSGCADTCMVLSWEDLPRADYYKVQIGGTCGLGAVRDVVGTDTTLCGLDWNATYYWRVRAINDCEMSSSWSECRSFATLLDGVEVPDLTQPPHMATCMDTSVLLDWEDVPSAVTYEVQIDTTCGSPLTHYGYTESEMTVNGLDRNTTYYWRVRARDGCDQAGKWSTCSGFTTRGTGIPDNNAGKWALHYAGPHSTGNDCSNHGLSGCGDLVVDAPSGPGRYDIYVVAIDVGVVKETRFGLRSDICPLVFYSWTPCDTPYEKPSSGWPGCGESNQMIWSTPQCGPFKVLGVLDVYSYGGSTLGTDIDQRVGYAEWCDDGVPPRRITITNEDKFGWIGFGEAGYNPCGLVSVIPRGSDRRPAMLGQNAPNPARRSIGTTIHYSLATAGKATISIFDVAGRRVREIELYSKSGENQISWDCRDQNGRLVPSGVYFYQLCSPGFSSEKKMLVAE